MHYKLRERILKSLSCNLLVVTSNHIVLCQHQTLQLYSFKGEEIREWILDATIRYIKIIGGPANREGLLVGMKNGQVVKIFIDNSFPIPLIKHDYPIRCLDISKLHKKIAIVDDNLMLAVYDISKKEKTIYEGPANSVAWNTEFDEMLCYSGDAVICVKTALFQTHKQKMDGFVVGFNGSKIFCLQNPAMKTIDVVQSVPLRQYLKVKDFHST
eukprot:UN25151